MMRSKLFKGIRRLFRWRARTFGYVGVLAFVSTVIIVVYGVLMMDAWVICMGGLISIVAVGACFSAMAHATWEEMFYGY